MSPERLRRLRRAALGRGRALARAARAAFAAGRPERGRALLDAAVLRDPNAAWRLDLALDRAAGTDPAAALVRVDGLLRRPGGLPEGWLRAVRAEVLRLPALARNVEALAELDRAAALEPRSAWVAACRGRALFHGGARRAGLAELARAARLAPACGWIRAWRGEALRVSGRAAAAAAALDAAARLDPAYPWTYAWRAGARLAAGRSLTARGGGTSRVRPGVGHPRAALADLARFLAVEAGYPWAWRARAEALRRLGDAAGADAVLRRVARGDLGAAPGGPGGRLSPFERRQAREAARDFARLAGPEAADRALSRGSAASEALVAAAWEGEALNRLGRPRRALAALDRALARRPGDGWARAWRAEALLALGRAEEARAEAERALRLDPAYPRAWAARALARRRLGDAAGAARDFSSAARGAGAAAWLHGWRGEALLAAGAPRRALPALARALELDGSFADAWAWRGEALRRLGRLAEARAAFERALALRPGHRLAGLGLGLAALPARDYRTAARALEAAA